MRNFYKNCSLFCLFVLIILLAIDIWFYLNRGNNYAIYSSKPYNFFYGNKPGIKSLKYEKGTLIAEIDSRGKSLKLLNEPSGLFDGKAFLIPLNENRTIKFILENDKEYLLSVEFYPLAVETPRYEVDCKQENCIAEIVSTDFSILPPGPEPEFWIPDYSNAHPPKSWMTKLKELKGSSESFEQQLQSIADFMIPYFVESMGTPSIDMINSDVGTQIKKMLDKTDSVWCSTISSITAFSLNSIGIKTRLVLSQGKAGDMLMRNHQLNEILDIDSNEWFFTDLPSHILFVKNSDGIKINFIQMVNYLNNGDLSGLKFCYWDGPESGFKTAGFSQIPESIRNNFKIYYQWHRFIIYPSGKSYIFNPQSLFAKIKDYLIGYRYLYSEFLSEKSRVSHLIFRASLYLTAPFMLISFFFSLLWLKNALRG